MINPEVFERAMELLKANSAGQIHNKNKAYMILHAALTEEDRKVRGVFKWLLGETGSFPEAKEGDHEHWRLMLKIKLKEINFDIFE